MEQDLECAICGEIYFQTRDKKKEKVNETPIGPSFRKTLIEKSTMKGDDKWRTWDNKDLLHCHDSCRATYYEGESQTTKQRTTSSASSSSAAIESSLEIADDFDFEVFCLFCGKQWDRSTGGTVKENWNQILGKLSGLDDDFALKLRVKNPSALIDIRARFHDECYEDFSIRADELSKSCSRRNCVHPEAYEALNRVYQ